MVIVMAIGWVVPVPTVIDDMVVEGSGGVLIWAKVWKWKRCQCLPEHILYGVFACGMLHLNFASVSEKDLSVESLCLIK